MPGSNITACISIRPRQRKRPAAVRISQKQRHPPARRRSQRKCCHHPPRLPHPRMPSPPAPQQRWHPLYQLQRNPPPYWSNQTAASWSASTIALRRAPRRLSRRSSRPRLLPSPCFPPTGRPPRALFAALRHPKQFRTLIFPCSFDPCVHLSPVILGVPDHPGTPMNP